VSPDAAEFLSAANIGTEDTQGRMKAFSSESLGAEGKFIAGFIAAIARHRTWAREPLFRPDLDKVNSGLKTTLIGRPSNERQNRPLRRRTELTLQNFS
jgi:hypothetical protein